MMLILSHLAHREDLKLFYERCIAYIRLWENSFGNASKFLWVDEN